MFLLLLYITGESKPRLLKLFFQIAPYKEIKNAIAPSNKTTQKTTFKTPKTFFLLLIFISRISSLSSKLTTKYAWNLFLLFICNSKISSIILKLLPSLLPLNNYFPPTYSNRPNFGKPWSILLCKKLWKFIIKFLNLILKKKKVINKNNKLKQTCHLVLSWISNLNSITIFSKYFN